MIENAQNDERLIYLMETALAMPPEERDRYLREACGDDKRLLNQVLEYVDWQEKMTGFLEEPIFEIAAVERPLQPGELLEERFRIVRQLAEGGMGIVYEAFDEKLERRVALKCAKAGFRKRLPPEVRNATAISHPNVCRLFEIHTASSPQGEVDFVTMEFLEGETLSARLERGPIPVEEARKIALQICAGVAEAHRNGVIHGDLKSGNVILTRDSSGGTRAVITDFGLARAVEASFSTMQSDHGMGTPIYMAPELWAGEKATVASDVYALGVIMYELKIPKWDETVQRCLAAEPGARFASADAIARAISPRSKVWFATAAVAGVLAIGSGIVTYHAATGPAETIRLAVMPISNADDAMQKSIVAELKKLGGGGRANLKIVPITGLLSGLASSAEKVPAVVSATHALQASIDRTGDRITLTSSLGNQRWKASYAASEAKYIPTAIAGMVSYTLHLQPARPTISAAARGDYEAGIAYLRRNSGINASLPLLESAVAKDPDSPLVHAGLAEGRWWKYKSVNDRAWRGRAVEAVMEAERRHPDFAELHRIAGLLDADAGHYEQAVARYLRSIELQPGSGDGHRRLAMAYDSNNQPELALAAYKHAVAVDGGNYRNHQALGDYYRKRADYAEAAKHFRTTVELVPDEPLPHFALGAAYLLLGSFAEAEAELSTAVRLGETPAALNALGTVLMYRGRDRDAVPMFQRSIELGPSQFLRWTNLGAAYRRLGSQSEATRAFQRALELAEAEMQSNPRNGYVRASLAYLYARLGDSRRAQSEVIQALQLAPQNADAQWMAVQAYEALGLRDNALEVLQTASSQVVADVSRYPDLADLRADSRFQSIITARQGK